MPKKQKLFRVAPVTLEQLAQLAEWRGQNQTEIFATAIDLLWQEESRKRIPQGCPNCGTLMNWYPHLNAYVQQCDCE